MKGIVAICLCLATWASPAELWAAGGPESEVVAELWFLSVRRSVTQPEIAVYADGMVRTVREDGSPLVGQISSAELAAVQEELLATCGLATLETPRLVEEIMVTSRRENLSAHIPNADETVIRIRDNAGELREVRCPAVPLLAVRFPGVAGLQGLYKAQLRLENIRTIQQVGGDRVAQQLAQYATSSLQTEQPGAAPLTIRELAMVRRFPDGTRYIQFCRQQESAGARVAPLIVGVTEVPGDNPRVSVFGGQGTLR